jgi:hypothetical protein
VERFKGKPFALLGVNIDRDPEGVRTLQNDGRLTWRSFSGDVDRIVAAYGVHALPTIVLIDHKGVVQWARVGVPEGDELEKKLDELVAAAEVGQ